MNDKQQIANLWRALNMIHSAADLIYDGVEPRPYALFIRHTAIEAMTAALPDEELIPLLEAFEEFNIVKLALGRDDDERH